MIIASQSSAGVNRQNFGLLSDRSRFWIEVPGFGTLYFRASANIDGVDVNDFDWRPCDDTWRFVASNHHGEWILSFLSHEGVSTNQKISVQLEGRLNNRASRATLIPVKFDAFSADHVVCHGRKMGGCSLYSLTSGRTGDLKSTFFVSITKEGWTLQLSHRLEQEDLSEFTGRIDGQKLCELSSETVFDPCRSETLVSDKVTFSSSENGHRLILEWADEQKALPEPRPLPVDCGWNTWDYYRWTITEEEVLRNADFIASDPVLCQHVKRIIIDDGWQYCYGEWEPNALFPSGMEKLAQHLRKMGFTPGLWFAPTIIEPHSRIAQLDSDMLAMGLSGLPCLSFCCMERRGFILDPTVERSQVWLKDLFRRYKSYGFDYFKLDFLASTLSAPRFADERVPRGHIMRKIITPIREAIGSQSTILACNYQFEGGAGLVNDVRISSDIHAQWESVKRNVASIATRFWSNQRFWTNDPDFVVCRGEETSDDPDLHRLKPLLVHVRPEDKADHVSSYLSSLVDLSKTEAEVLLSLVMMSGGSINLSDNLLRLNTKGLELVRKIVSAEKGEAAIPVDLFRAELPSVWVQKMPSRRHRVLLVNWMDEDRELTVDLTALNLSMRNATNFWTGEHVSIVSGKIASQLPAHGCLLVEG